MDADERAELVEDVVEDVLCRLSGRLSTMAEDRKAQATEWAGADDVTADEAFFKIVSMTLHELAEACTDVVGDMYAAEDDPDE